MRVSPSLGLLGLLASNVAAQQACNSDCVRNATRPIVDHILGLYNNSSYKGGIIPGLFPGPYYWWEAGLAWDALIKYWALSGDDSVVDTISQALLFQTGPDDNYMPLNQSKSLGNDDQSFWAHAAMTAAEYGLPEGRIRWVQLAENVFNSQVLRWDNATCGGGLRWQIFTFNNGYSYKNSMTQGAFAYLGARLALYTGNSTYLDWAKAAVDWSSQIGFIGANHRVYDGASAQLNCSQINHLEWTISTGFFMNAAAYAVNMTSDRYWNAHLAGTVFNTNVTFTRDDGVIYEVACAANKNCNIDQQSFKAGLSRALGNARDLTGVDGQLMNGGLFVGTLHQGVQDIIAASAQGASRQCSTSNGCGFNWTSLTYDNYTGLGQNIAALEIVLANVPGKMLHNINGTVSKGSGSTNNGTSTSGGSNGTQTTGSSPTRTGGASSFQPYASLASFGALAVLFFVL